jgi:hypothetical protein
VRKDRLARARLARDGVQAVAEAQFRPIDEEKVLYAQLEKHRSCLPAAPDGTSS